MSLINEAFGSGFDLYKFLSQRAKTKNIYKKILVRELRNNIERLEHRNVKGVNKLAIIKNLENASIVEAMRNGYDLNKLALNQVVDPKFLKKNKQAKKYSGWNAERVLLSIDEKIVVLKELEDFYPDVNKAPINLSSRLNNLYLLCVLLSLMIKRAL